MRKAIGLNVVILVTVMVATSGAVFAGKTVTGSGAPDSL
jgi:hypothetical protein